MFRIYFCDLFILKRDIGMTSHADDISSYVYGENINPTIESLENASSIQWLNDRHLKANEDKCCYVLLSTNENVLVNILVQYKFKIVIPKNINCKTE